MRIRYFCFWGALTGFGRAARDYVAALTAAGHEIEVIDWTSIPGSARAADPAKTPESRYRELDRLVVPWPDRVDDGALAIYHAQPRLLARMVEEKALPAGHARHAAVAMTTWETSRFPIAFAEPILDAFHIIVPSAFCAQSLADHMALDTEDVKVVPHTFDAAWWVPDAVPLPPYMQPLGAAHRDNHLRFYTMGAWSERKNHGAVIRAFLHAFGTEDRVRLTIFSHNMDKGAIRSLMARSGISSGFPEICVDHRQYDDVLGMHREGDVFVSAARGEGWGLPCFEAAVLGKTIISPVYSGECEYLLGTSEMSPWHYTTATAPRYAGLRDVAHTLTPSFAGTGTPVIKGDQIVGEKIDHVPGMTCKDVWAEPSIYELSQRMRTVYEQHQIGNHFTGAQSRDSLVERFGYDVVARRLTSVLERICR